MRTACGIRRKVPHPVKLRKRSQQARPAKRRPYLKVYEKQNSILSRILTVLPERPFFYMNLSSNSIPKIHVSCILQLPSIKPKKLDVAPNEGQERGLKEACNLKGCARWVLLLLLCLHLRALRVEAASSSKSGSYAMMEGEHKRL